MLCSLARIDGFRSAMSMAGLEVDPELIRFGDFHVTGGFRNAEQLLDLPDRPTAIFAGSDLQGLGVLEAARVRGLRVPTDLSVVGYDDIPLARWSSPALTTVHQPLRRMAETAAQMVLQLRRGEATEPRIELGTELVVRQSTTAPPGRTTGAPAQA
jgi:LacI family xylobiose transport system transcriptional regulator